MWLTLVVGKVIWKFSAENSKSPSSLPVIWEPTDNLLLYRNEVILRLYIHISVYIYIIYACVDIES